MFQSSTNLRTEFLSAAMKMARGIFPSAPLPNPHSAPVRTGSLRGSIFKELQTTLTRYLNNPRFSLGWVV
jgi:hypothetical protein